MPIDPTELRNVLKRHRPSNVPQSYSTEPHVEDAIQAIPAAVLVALHFDLSEGWQVLLTRRSKQLSNHAGQISFVGGQCEPSDANSIATALREAKEEIGLPSTAVEIIGRLRPYLVARKYLITPHVGIVKSFIPKIDPIEVEALLSIPLGFFFQNAHCLPDQRYPKYLGKQFFYENENIWGATASILLNLKDIIKNADKISPSAPPCHTAPAL